MPLRPEGMAPKFAPLASVLSVLLTAAGAFAQGPPGEYTWNTTSGNWSVGANWQGGQVPGPSDTVVINTAAAATITIQAGDNIQIQALTTGSNDTLSFTGGSLIVVYLPEILASMAA